MVNFGPVTAEICWRVWGPQQISTGFCVLASLLQRRRSTEANQTLHDVWQSPGLVHYTTEICYVQNSLCVQVLRSPVLAALLHGTRAVGVSETAASYN